MWPTCALWPSSSNHRPGTLLPHLIRLAAATAGYAPHGMMELAFSQDPATSGMSAWFVSNTPTKPEIADILRGRDSRHQRVKLYLIPPGLPRSQVQPGSQGMQLQLTLALSARLIAT